MSTSIAECGRLLAQQGVRHHVDAEQEVIRVVLVTQRYRNRRDEKLAVINLEAPDDGRRVRLCIRRAFETGADPATLCLAACRLAADTPLVSAEFDADFDDLRLVVEMAVEDGALGPLQLASMIDRLVDAAEVWSVALGMECPAQRGRGAA